MSTNSRLNKLLVGGIDVIIYLACFYSYIYSLWQNTPPTGWQAVLQMPWFVIVFIVLAVIYNLYSEYTKYDEIIVSIACLVLIAILENSAVFLVPPICFSVLYF